jgi:DNA polymerase elongation subunit (family B)
VLCRFGEKMGKDNIMETIRGNWHTLPGGLNYTDGSGFYPNGAVEMDFVSYYPQLLEYYNLSYETVGIFTVQHVRLFESELRRHPTNYIFFSYLTHKSKHQDIYTRELINGSISSGGSVSLEHVLTCLAKSQLVLVVLKTKNGILPIIFRELNELRRTTPSASLKRMCSSVYGLLGSKYSPIQGYHVAAAITYLGRYNIIRAVQSALDCGLCCIYVDTDAVFIRDYNNQPISHLPMTSKHFEDILVFSKKKYIGTVNGEIIHRGLTKDRHLGTILECCYNICTENTHVSPSELCGKLNVKNLEHLRRLQVVIYFIWFHTTSLKIRCDKELFLTIFDAATRFAGPYHVAIR